MERPKITLKEDAFVAWQNYLIFICERIGNTNVKKGLEEQAELINNNKLIEFDIIPDVSVTHTGQDNPTKWAFMPVVCFKSVKCKYRPHLYFGDYYVVLVDRVSEFQYYFMSKRINYDKSVSWEYAQHPHISSGNPCLGNFQGDMNTAIDVGNVYQFLSVTKKYLEKYNGRSVFTRGTRYKPETFTYKMVSETEFWEEYGEDENIDYNGIMRDSSRWGFPAEMAGMGEFSLAGHDRCSYQRAKHGIMGSRGAPYSSTPIKHSHPTILQEDNCVIGADWYQPNTMDNGFYDGYVYWVSVLLECSILESQWLINRYFNSLYAKFKGVRDIKEEQILKGVFLEWNKFMRPTGPRVRKYQFPIVFGKTLEYPANGTTSQQQNWLFHADQTTYRIKIPTKLIAELKPMYEQLSGRFGGSGGTNSNTTFTGLVKPPNKIASKIVAITQNNKSLETLDYKKLMGQEVPIDITEECLHLADKLRAHVLEEYHTNLGKEKGRVLNEWKEINPSKAPRSQSDDWGEPGEQASLFSDTL